MLAVVLQLQLQGRKKRRVPNGFRLLRAFVPFRCYAITSPFADVWHMIHQMRVFSSIFVVSNQTAPHTLPASASALITASAASSDVCLPVSTSSSHHSGGPQKKRLLYLSRAGVKIRAGRNSS
jgi:hypothetical protein